MGLLSAPDQGDDHDREYCAADERRGRARADTERGGSEGLGVTLSRHSDAHECMADMQLCLHRRSMMTKTLPSLRQYIPTDQSGGLQCSVW